MSDELSKGETAKVPSSLEEGVGGGGVSRETLRQRARSMRNNPTEPENKLWQALKGKQLRGCKFRRQQVVGRRIVDFYCPSWNLVVELDGDTHDPEIDTVRDQRLETDFGVRVIRFTNEDVMRNLDGVLMRLTEVVGASNHPQPPPYPRRGSSIVR